MEECSHANYYREYMREMLPTARSYKLIILKTTPKRREPGLEKIIWEHGRRNFALRAEGVMPIVCPVTDGGDVAGIGVFIENARLDDQAIEIILSWLKAQL